MRAFSVFPYLYARAGPPFEPAGRTGRRCGLHARAGSFVVVRAGSFVVVRAGSFVALRLNRNIRSKEASGAAAEVSGAAAEISGAAAEVWEAAAEISGAAAEVSGAAAEISGAAVESEKECLFFAVRLGVFRGRLSEVALEGGGEVGLVGVADAVSNLCHVDLTLT